MRILRPCHTSAMEKQRSIIKFKSVNITFPQSIMCLPFDSDAISEFKPTIIKGVVLECTKNLLLNETDFVFLVIFGVTSSRISFKSVYVAPDSRTEKASKPLRIFIYIGVFNFYFVIFPRGNIFLELVQILIHLLVIYYHMCPAQPISLTVKRECRVEKSIIMEITLLLYQLSNFLLRFCCDRWTLIFQEVN